MANNQRDSDRDRRSGPDTLTKSIRWVAVAGWLFLLASLIFIDLAKPEFVTFFDRHFEIAEGMRTTWNMSLARIIFYLMVGGFFFGAYGFIVNITRSRRKTDRYRLNLLTLSIVSLFGAIYYLIYF